MQQKSMTIIAAFTATLFSTTAQAQATKIPLQESLVAKYPPTTLTADSTDIVTAGSVLTLKKAGLTASVASAKVPTPNNFKDKDPQIRPSATASAKKTLGKLGGLGGFIPGASMIAGAGAVAGDTRPFANGEKLFVTGITVDPVKDSVTFDLLSDAYKNIRFRAQLRFEFAKGSLATADLPQVQGVLDQAIAVTPPAADSNASAQAPPNASALVAPPAAVQTAGPVDPSAPALTPIPRPPPPQAEPQSIENGMTKDQVVAIMGQPISTAKADTKEIYTYKDLKITFVNGKMTDVQ